MTTHASGKRVLVTGGAGFIGSHLTDLLLSRGDRVTIVDDLSTGRRRNLPASHERLRFIEADLGHALAAFGKGEVFDEVYHLAAAVGVKLVTTDPIRSIETNIEQTSALLRYVSTHGNIPTLLASSSEVYGKSAGVPFRESDDVAYGPTTVPRWSYACSKAVDEYLGLAYFAQRGLPVVIARFFNTVGPRQVGDYGMVLPRFVGAAIENKPIDVYGDGEQSRCFCDVRDVASSLPRLLGTKECHGRVFNVGSDQPITIRALAELVVKTIGSTSSIKRIPYAQAYGENFEDLRQRRPDLSRVSNAIGFNASIPIERTIKDLAAEIAGGRTARGDHS